MNTEVAWLKEVKEWGVTIIGAVVLAFLIMFFIRPTLVYGSSMEPTLMDKQYLAMSKASVVFWGLKEGDIIVFETDLKTEGGNNKNLIKRVIGVPGDQIDIENGVVSRNGTPLEEAYIKSEPAYPTDTVHVKVPEGHYFAMGDNRLNSHDSRDSDVGLVPQQHILGKVLFRILPFDQAGAISNQ